jgi:hypothetical protein
MMKPLLALLLATAPAVAATSQNTPAGRWTLASSTEGCVVHAASGKGTILSIAASPAQDALMFVVQNPELAALEDGAQYPVQVEFDQMGAWQIEATAQHEIDSDGPGIMFAVQPGREDGANFIKEFAAAEGMHIGDAGDRLDSLPLTGSDTAMAGMAECLGQMLGATGTAAEEKPLFEGGGKAVKI